MDSEVEKKSRLRKKLEHATYLLPSKFHPRKASLLRRVRSILTCDVGENPSAYAPECRPRFPLKHVSPIGSLEIYTHDRIYHNNEGGQERPEEGEDDIESKSGLNGVYPTLEIHSAGLTLDHILGITIIHGLETK